MVYYFRSCYCSEGTKGGEIILWGPCQKVTLHYSKYTEYNKHLHLFWSKCSKKTHSLVDWKREFCFVCIICCQFEYPDNEFNIKNRNRITLCKHYLCKHGLVENIFCGKIIYKTISRLNVNISHCKHV